MATQQPPFLPNCTFADEVLKEQEDSALENAVEMEQENSEEVSFKTTLKSSVLMIKSSELEIEEHNRQWIDYTRSRLEDYDIVSQDARPISNHHVSVGNSVKTFLLRPGMILLYRRKDEIVPIILKSKNPENLRASVYGENEKTFSFLYKNIVKEPEEVCQFFKNLDHKYKLLKNDPHFYAVQDFRDACDYEDVALYQCVKPGQWFEMQIPDNPQYVALTQVLRNHRGLLLVKCGEEQFWVHMMDRHLHEVGWVGKQLNDYHIFGQKVFYVPGYANEDIFKAKQNRAPSFVFRNNYIPLHRLKKGDIVVVSDARSKAMYYSHVIETDDRSAHFFHLSVGQDIVSNGNGKKVFFHIYHPRIFSPKRIQDSGIQIRTPSTMNLQTNETNLAAYKRVFTPTGRVVGENCGNQADFNRDVLSKWSSDKSLKDMLDSVEKNLRFVEVLRLTPTGSLQLKGAIVTGQREYILRLKAADEVEPFYLHFNDINIFHLGSCFDMGLAISFDAETLDRKARDKERERATNGFATF